jgi:hypothetical protein
VLPSHACTDCGRTTLSARVGEADLLKESELLCLPAEDLNHPDPTCSVCGAGTSDRDLEPERLKENGDEFRRIDRFTSLLDGQGR